MEKNYFTGFRAKRKQNHFVIFIERLQNFEFFISPFQFNLKSNY